MPVQSSEELEHIRSALDELTGKWSLLVLNALCNGSARFNALKRLNKGVSQKALTQCLRRHEASSLITRTVVSTHSQLWPSIFRFACRAFTVTLPIPKI
ncbi:helix-turn-helix domain-containing protein [Martelella sp. FLE1502]